MREVNDTLISPVEVAVLFLGPSSDHLPGIALAVTSSKAELSSYISVTVLVQSQSSANVSG